MSYEEHYTTRTSTRTSTLAIDAKIINEFAKKNAPLARRPRALQVPPIPSCYEYDEHGNINTGTSKSSTLKSMTISDYFRFRNWNAEYIDHDITNALISYAMTFVPLTLAYHADDVMHKSPRGGTCRTLQVKIRTPKARQIKQKTYQKITTASSSSFQVVYVASLP